MYYSIAYFLCIYFRISPYHSVLGVQHHYPFFVHFIVTFKQRLGHSKLSHTYILDNGSQLFGVTNQNNLKMTLTLHIVQEKKTDQEAVRNYDFLVNNTGSKSYERAEFFMNPGAK